VVADDGVEQCVRDIRRALGDETQCILKTVPRRGYIFTADVTTMVPPVLASGSSSIEDDRTRGPALMQGPACGVSPVCLIVKPFANLGGHPNDARLAASLREDLVTNLARLPAISLVDSDMTCADGRRLDAIRYVVAGSVRRGVGGLPGVDGKLWITLRLSDAASGVCLWADRFSMDLTDTEMAWCETVARLANAIEFSVMNSVTSYRGFEIGGDDDRAERLSLLGWATLQQFQAVNVVHRARAYFEQALRTDPDLADAKVGMAMTSVNLIANFWSTFEQENEARIEQLLLEAIDCGGPSSRALLTLGMLRRVQDRLPESRIVLQVAIASEPHNAWAIRQLGYTLLHLGEHAAATREIEKSLRLNPYGGVVAGAYQSLGHCHLFLNDLERSVAFSRESAVRNPWLVSTHLGLASALASSGELRDAKATMRRVWELKPEWQSVTAIRRSLPYTHPNYVAAMNDSFFAGLRRAGMPEQ
jgi:adenylate cyclase